MVCLRPALRCLTTPRLVKLPGRWERSRRLARCIQELHEDKSIPRVNFFRTCRNLLYRCEVNEFSLADWAKPEPARLKKNLSGIINFAKFWEDKLSQLNELTAANVRVHRMHSC
jgi:hypothetical protein